MPYEFLDFLDLFVTIVAASVLTFNLVYFNKLSSIGITAVGFVLVQAISVLLTQPIRTGLYNLNPHMALLVFYFFFAFMNLLAIVTIYRLHKTLARAIEWPAELCVRCLQALALIQVGRCLDRMVFWDSFGVIYQYSIPSINLAITLTLVFYTYREYASSRKMSGIKGF